jgi:hypothetical protein
MTREMAGKVLATLLMLAMWGCTTLAPIDARHYIPGHRPPNVWLSLRDGSTVFLRGPRVMPEGDTLVGFVGGGNQRLIPLADVTAARATRPAPGRTLLVVGGGALLIAGLLFTVTR